jgi:hypothetical protein
MKLFNIESHSWFIFWRVSTRTWATGLAILSEIFILKRNASLLSESSHDRFLCRLISSLCLFRCIIALCYVRRSCGFDISHIKRRTQACTVYSTRLWKWYYDVYATNKTGCSSDDWIYYHMVTHSLINYTYTQAMQCCLSFTHFTVHRCTRTRILSFH